MLRRPIPVDGLCRLRKFGPALIYTPVGQTASKSFIEICRSANEAPRRMRLNPVSVDCLDCPCFLGSSRIGRAGREDRKLPIHVIRKAIANDRLRV